MAELSAQCRAGRHAAKGWGELYGLSGHCYGTARDVVPVPGTLGRKQYIDHPCACECHRRTIAVASRSDDAPEDAEMEGEK